MLASIQGPSALSSHEFEGRLHSTPHLCVFLQSPRAVEVKVQGKQGLDVTRFGSVTEAGKGAGSVFETLMDCGARAG